MGTSQTQTRTRDVDGDRDGGGDGGKESLPQSGRPHTKAARALSADCHNGKLTKCILFVQVASPDPCPCSPSSLPDDIKMVK